MLFIYRHFAGKKKKKQDYIKTKICLEGMMLQIDMKHQSSTKVKRIKNRKEILVIIKKSNMSKKLNIC